MALITTIGAGIYTTLKYNEASTVPASVSAFDALTGTVGTVSDIREFPSFGTPANIVNVPVYGEAQSSQISGQADAPTLEFTLNYKADGHDTLQDLVGNNKTYAFEIALKNTSGSTGDDAVFYVLGTFASFTITPNLTDTNQATLTLATQGSYVGPVATSA
ncbi:MAG: hypothetical protein ACR2M7_03970 [Bdellovibrionales bacterium]